MHDGHVKSKKYGVVTWKVTIVKRLTRLGKSLNEAADSASVDIDLASKIVEDMKAESGGIIPYTKAQRGGGKAGQKRSRRPSVPEGDLQKRVNRYSTPEIRAKAVELRKQGLEYKEIGRILGGFHYASVIEWCHDVDPKQTNERVDSEPEAKITPVHVNFCSNCGHRIPNAIVGG